MAEIDNPGINTHAEGTELPKSDTYGNLFGPMNTEYFHVNRADRPMVTDMIPMMNGTRIDAKE